MAKVDAQGAVQSKTSLADKTRSYWGHHRESCMGSLQRLLSTPGQTLMTCLVVAIAMALPATLLVALSNIQQLGDSWDASPKISVYINLRARDTAIEQLVAKLKKYPEINAVDYYSAAQVLADFQRMSGFGEALDALDDNPLPATLVITPVAAATEPDDLKRLGERIGKEAIVDEVVMDMEWVRRLRELMVLGKKVVVALAGLLGLGVLLALGNTIRLAIENRREEIIVSKLVGGTNAFVRRPFIYSGAWYGLLGGVLASLIVALGFLIISGTVANLTSLYHSEFRLQTLGFTGTLQLVVLGTLLGWLGAWLAVGRHLAQIEPK